MRISPQRHRGHTEIHRENLCVALCDPCASVVKNFFLLCFFSLSLFAQPVSELPPINTVNFSPELREAVRKAYAEAQAKPREAEAVGRLGMTLQAYQQFELAGICYARARHFAPQEFRWQYYFGLTQAALAKYSEAVAALQEAVRLQPGDLPAQLRLAETLLAAGEFRASLPLFEALAKQSATRAQAQYGLGQGKLALGEKAAGIAHLQQALMLFPEFGAAHYALGLALRDQGQRGEAQFHLTMSQQHKYQRPPLPDPLAAAVASLNASATDQLQRGAELAAAGQLELAIAAHERALALNPKLVQAHINLISLRARAGQREKAEQHYQAAIAANPNLADSHFNYGVLLLGLDRFAEAAQAFQRSLERNPFNAEAHYNYAAIIERDGKLDEAAAHYRQALANNPEHRQAHFHYGRILVQQEKLPEAIEHLRQTIKIEDEDTPRFLYALGATYARAGDRAKALQYLREAQTRAEKRGQPELLAAITRDLKTLESKQ